MYIKQVSINSFKSYKSLTMNQNFSQNINLILGYNGSGKSSFFQAIMFVMSSHYSKISKEIKKRLIYEGISREEGPSELCTVEIKFDNGAKKFPSNLDEVKIKRAFDSKNDKDEFSINGKHIPLNDLISVLESSGFAYNNPYYFVQQGKIESLASINEESLLYVLSEVAGTKLYDEKREEGIMILNELKPTIDKAKELMKKIEYHLARLESESEKFQKVKKLTNEKDKLEGLILKNKIINIDKSIKSIQEDNDNIIEEFNKLNINENLKRKDYEDKKEKIELVQARIVRIGNSVSSLQEAMNEFQSEGAKSYSKSNKKLFQELIKGKKFNLKILSEKENEKTLALSKLNSFEETFQKLDLELKEIENEIEKLKANRELALFYNFIGSSEKSSKSSNGEDIQKKLEEEIKILEKQRKNEDEELNEQKELFEQLLHDLDRQKDINKNYKDNIIDIKRKLESENVKRQNIYLNIRTLQQSETEIGNQLEENEKCYLLTLRKLNMELGNNFLTNLIEIKKEMKIRNVKGFEGCLIDFIDLTNEHNDILDFVPFLDLVSSNILFSIISSDFNAAKEILEINKQKKGCVINIFPLDFFPIGSYPIPQFDEIKGVQRFLDKLKLKKDADPRIQEILNSKLSKTVLVSSYELALKISKEYKFICVTQSSEIVYPGAFASRIGSCQLQEDKIELYEKFKSYQNQSSSLKQKLNEIRKEIEIKNNESQNTYSDIQTLTNAEKQIKLKEDECQNLFNKLNSDIQIAESKCKNHENTLNNIQQAIDKANLLVKNYDANFKSSKEIKKLDPNQILQEINILETKLKTMRAEWQSSKEGISKSKDNLIFLDRQILNISQTLEEIEKNLTAEEKSKVNENVQVINERMDNLKLNLVNQENDLKETLEEKKKHLSEIQNIESALSEIEEEMAKYNSEIDKYKAEVGSLANEKKIIEEKISSIHLQDMKLGENFEEEKVLREIEAKNYELSKFPRINKEAVDLFQRCKGRIDLFKKRMDEANESEAAIRHAVEVLDQKKDEVFKSTFKQISHSFSKYFNQLTLTMKAKLKLEKIEDLSTQTQLTQNTTIHTQNAGFYKGVSIHAGKENDQKLKKGTSSLSGGQKAALAISLMLAIQDLETAPIYILDEIDASLDDEIRKNLSLLISEKAKASQFLISTFKKDLIEISDKIFKVEIENRSSNLIEISKEEAKNIISTGSKSVIKNS